MMLFFFQDKGFLHLISSAGPAAMAITAPIMGYLVCMLIHMQLKHVESSGQCKKKLIAKQGLLLVIADQTLVDNK